MINKCTETQGFGQNANSSYSADGLLGHTAIDIECGYGNDIYAEVDMYVYKVLDGNNPSGYTAVFGIDKEGNEWSYGHLDPTVQMGDNIKAGKKVGTEANHGRVFAGGVEITLEMQKAGDQRGHHTHVQKRACMPVERTKTSGRYLTTIDGGFLRRDDKYYEIVSYDNGYNGCVDWTKDQPVIVVDGVELPVIVGLSLSDELLVIGARRVGNREKSGPLATTLGSTLKAFGK